MTDNENSETPQIGVVDTLRLAEHDTQAVQDHSPDYDDSPSGIYLPVILKSGPIEIDSFHYLKRWCVITRAVELIAGNEDSLRYECTLRPDVEADREDEDPETVYSLDGSPLFIHHYPDNDRHYIHVPAGIWILAEWAVFGDSPRWKSGPELKRYKYREVHSLLGTGFLTCKHPAGHTIRPHANERDEEILDSEGKVLFTHVLKPNDPLLVFPPRRGRPQTRTKL